MSQRTKNPWSGKKLIDNHFAVAFKSVVVWPNLSAKRRPLLIATVSVCSGECECAKATVNDIRTLPNDP